MASCLYIFLNFIPILTSKSQYFLQGTSTRTNHILMLRLLYFNGHSGCLPFFLLIYSHNDFLCLSHTFLLPCNSDLVLLNGWRWDVDTCWSLFRDLRGIGSGYERMVKMFNVESFKGKFSLQKKIRNKKTVRNSEVLLNKNFPLNTRPPLKPGGSFSPSSSQLLWHKWKGSIAIPQPKPEWDASQTQVPPLGSTDH